MRSKNEHKRRPASEKIPKTASLDSTLFERALWRRWMGDSLLLPDGQRNQEMSKMAELLAKYCCSREHICLVLTAVARGLWDPILVEPALAKLTEMQSRNPKMLDGFVKALPAETQSLLPPNLLS